MHQYSKDKRPKAFDTGDHSYVQTEIGHSFDKLARQLMGDPRIMETVRSKQSKVTKLQAYSMLSCGKSFKQPQYYSELEQDNLAKNLIADTDLIDKHYHRAMEENERQKIDALRHQVREEVRRELSASIDTNNTRGVNEP